MVKLRSDQERVKALLKETITLLCKNGLEYKTRFCVDALIGITLDEEDVFMVKISETISDRGLNNNTNGDPAPLNFSVSSQSASPPHEPQSLPPVHDVQPVQDSHHLQSNVSPPATANSTSHRPSPAPRKQANPQPLSLTQNRKRRASSSPMRHVEKPENDCEQKSNDIPQQSVVTTGAISNVSELSNQSSTPSDPEPITVEPMSPEDGHSNLINKSASDIENDPSVQDAPLNFSKSSHDKKDDASCSSWDPSRIQQQVAQAAAASYASGPDVKSTESLPVKSEPPTIDGSPATSEQDSWNTIQMALKMKKGGGGGARSQTSEEDVGYFYALSNTPYHLEKRYVCDFAGCNYTTSRKYNLMRHGRTHHEDLRIPCPECPGTFVDKYILKEHMAAAHPKFSIPIDGTNMIGVGIGDTKSPNGGEPVSKKKRTPQTQSPGQRRGTPKSGKDSPQHKRKSAGGWHIPKMGPMPPMGGIPPQEGDVGADLSKLNVEPFLNHNGDSRSFMDSFAGDKANNNVMKSAYEVAVSSGFNFAAMQSVFPGMDMMSIIRDPDLSNNNKPLKPPVAAKDPADAAPTDLSAAMQAVFPGMDVMAGLKHAPGYDTKQLSKDEDDSGPTDLSTGMSVVFPGMEMEDSNGGVSESSPSKGAGSIIETSDGEEVKVSE